MSFNHWFKNPKIGSIFKGNRNRSDFWIFELNAFQPFFTLIMQSGNNSNNTTISPLSSIYQSRICFVICDHEQQRNLIKMQ